jgi:hypothetical protein
MALRLRRGTDAQRQLITPTEGELIYVTDTKELYAGDGTTVGGIRISGEVVDTLNQLDDVDAALPQDGDILIYDSATGDWVAGELPLVDLPDVNAAGILDGQILAWDADTSSFIPTNNIGGGDTSFVGDLVGSVFSDSSSLIVDGINSTVTARILSSNGTEVLYNGTDGTNAAFTGSTIGDHLGNVTGSVDGNLQGNVVAEDSSVILFNGSDGTDAVFTGESRGNHFGAVIGDVNGNLQGDVYGRDSSIILDTTENSAVLRKIVSSSSFYAEGTSIVFYSQDGFINVGGPDPDGDGTHQNNAINLNREGNTGSGFISSHYGNSNSRHSDLKAIKYRGTIDSPTAVQTNDNLLEITSNGYDGTTIKGAGGINWIATGTAGTLAVPSKVQINVGNVAGDAASTFIGDSDGSWITDIMKLNPLSSAPATPAAGMVAVDDGSNWSGVATNGTDETVVAYLNSTWVKLG